MKPSDRYAAIEGYDPGVVSDFRITDGDRQIIRVLRAYHPAPVSLTRLDNTLQWSGGPSAVEERLKLLRDAGHVIRSNDGKWLEK